MDEAEDSSEEEDDSSEEEDSLEDSDELLSEDDDSADDAEDPSEDDSPHSHSHSKVSQFQYQHVLVLELDDSSTRLAYNDVLDATNTPAEKSRVIADKKRLLGKLSVMVQVVRKPIKLAMGILRPVRGRAILRVLFMTIWSTTVAPLLRQLQESRGTPFNEARLESAYRLAEQLYLGKEHWTGVPLLAHSLGVLQVLAPFQPDEDTIIACLLQHALQSRRVAMDDLEEQFGPTVRALVSSIHLLSHVTMKDRRHSIEDLRLMLLSVSDDVRVVLVILCERCYALEHMANLSKEEKRHLCDDVLNLFAPVSARLGIHSLKQRLEGLSFPVLYPNDEERISEQMRRVHGTYGEFLHESAQTLMALLQEQGITAMVSGREKHPYSIFSKMRAKTVSQVEKIPDLFALRVVVSTEEECYRVLGLLHRMGRPVANRFKDYIAFPKPNGYRSLHTTIARLPGVPEGVFVEVQIRTHAMHREAEYGIAAHWSYKEGGAADRMIQRVQLHQVLTRQQALEHSEGNATLVDHIFVLTPKGDIIELPEGATPLDFAFQIHTDLGLGFRAARVNGSIVPLDYELENGDVVEVLTHRVPQPSTEWLQLLKMSSSRSRLKRYLYSLNRDGLIARGRELVNDELRKIHAPLLDTELSQLRRYDGRVLSFSEREDQLVKIGQGSEKVGALFLHADHLAALRSASSIMQTPHLPRLQRKDSVIEIEGGLRMPIRYAKCCKPQEGEKGRLIGSVNRRGEVTVHRATCGLLKNANPGRQIGVRWKEAAPAEPKKRKKAPVAKAS